MFWIIMRAELMKLKQSRIAFPVVLAPLLIVLLQLANFFVRYDSVVKPGADPWTIFIAQHLSMWALLTLPILVAILSGMVVSIENTNNSWKYMFSLPFKRGYLYFVKVALVLFFIIISSVILGIGMIASAMLLNLSGAVPVDDLVKTIGAALLGTFAVLAVQFWLSIRFKNSGIPLGVAICATVAAIFFVQSTFTHWLPWVYPYLTLPITLNEGTNVMWYICQSLIVGIICLWAGCREFVRRDV